MGADFLEQDLVATRDAELVVLHDIHLNDICNVRSVYPERCRADGKFYVIDFDLAELRRLRLTERRSPGTSEVLFPGRFSKKNDGFRVVSFDEEIELVRALNLSTGRSVGIYPEIKAPQWHRDEGINVTGLIVASLERHGYQQANANVFLQCFDRAELERVAGTLATGVPLIQLFDTDSLEALGTDIAAWEQISHYADGVGVPYQALLADPRASELRSSRLAEIIRASGLLIHPYTFRRDRLFDARHDFSQLLAFFIHDLCVDALFCDHPDVALAARAGATCPAA
jgi:glycerophosphoryl diester phosphodiesterase